MFIKKTSLSILLIVLFTISINAQQYLDPEYIKVTEKRASKIVENLDVSNKNKSELIIQIIAKQYQNLSKIHDEKDAKIKAIKVSNKTEEKQKSKIEKVKQKADKLLKKLHKS